MKNCNFINFRPHIGQNYSSKGFKGKRILVLGESHYCTKELEENGRCFPQCKTENMLEVCNSQTEDVVRDLIYSYSGHEYELTFTCFERSVLGKVPTQREREEFWEGVIFYNYLQFCLPGNRCPVPDDYWAQSELAFYQLLETYLPDYIISWGVRLYKHLPKGVDSLLTIDGDSTDVRTYTIREKLIPMLKIYHPAAR